MTTTGLDYDDDCDCRNLHRRFRHRHIFRRPPFLIRRRHRPAYRGLDEIEDHSAHSIVFVCILKRPLSGIFWMVYASRLACRVNAVLENSVLEFRS